MFLPSFLLGRLTAPALIFVILLLVPCGGACAARLAPGQPGWTATRDSSFNLGWRFFRGPQEDSARPPDFNKDPPPAEAMPSYDDSAWEQVILPHSPRIEPFNTYLPWQGLCWYRKTITCPAAWRCQRVSLEFQGAMQVADAWVNGEHRLTHYGGFLPFTLDLSQDAASGKRITVAVEVDNRDNGLVPPGKPLRNADFEYYGGLYRDVILHVTDPLHIMDAVSANKVAGGGLFVTFPAIRPVSTDPRRALVRVQTDVGNDFASSKTAIVMCALTDSQGRLVNSGTSQPVIIASGMDREVADEILVPSARLWSPDHPYLYRLHVLVKDGARAADEESILIGIRRFSFSVKTGFTINGHPLFLHGANRHQYYPWVGDAIPDNEQYRDMVRLKEAGWNFVRLCHYPQSPQIMDACDRLGLVALICSPGWQWYSADPIFSARVQQADQDMVRWHRNHASAMLWEVTLNEEYAPIDKVKRWAAAIRGEFPEGECFLSGDTKDYGDPKDFDLDAPYPGWNSAEHPAPGSDISRKRIVREYGAQAQDDRDTGDAGMLNQTFLAEESYSDIRRQPVYMGAARWSYMDYVRGFDPSIYASGAVTIDRIPKFLYYWHKSQRDADMKTALFDSGPMVYIPNYWQPNSPRDVTVFSNCDQVELFLNGVSQGKQSADHADRNVDVAHPEFTFAHLVYAPGTLKAIGYLHGKPIVTTSVSTPGAPAKIKLVAEEMGRPLAADGNDVIFIRAEILDAHGSLVPNAALPIQFSVTANGAIVGDNPRTAGAGIASCLLRAGLKTGPITVTATSPGVGTTPLMVQAVRPNPALRAWM
jgi:beta-galactosidase